MTPRCTALATALLLVAVPLHAQQFSLRLGGLRTHYADSLDAQAGSVSGQAAWTGSRTQGVVEASWSQFNTGSGAAQAWGSFAVIGPHSRSAALGARVEGVTNAIAGSSWTASSAAELFAALSSRGAGVSLGISGGGVRSVDTSRFGTAGAALRAWLSRGPWTVGAAASSTTSLHYHFQDVTASADFHRGRVTAGGQAAARHGDLGGKPWYQGRASLRATPRISFEAALGSYPRDIAGYDRGHFASAGIRLRVGPATRPMDGIAGLPSRVQVQRLDDSRTLVTFLVADAAPAIVGSWNEWTPTAMNDAGGGRWSIILPVGAGTFRFALVLNDGRWVVPDGVTKLPDDFDGEVGILVVRR